MKEIKKKAAPCHKGRRAASARTRVLSLYQKDSEEITCFSFLSQDTPKRSSGDLILSIYVLRKSRVSSVKLDQSKYSEKSRVRSVREVGRVGSLISIVAMSVCWSVPSAKIS